MKYRISYITDVGPVRENNEDNYCIPGVSQREDEHNEGTVIVDDGIPSIVAVFDGMGGEAYGQEASAIAAQTFSSGMTDLAGDIWDGLDSLSIKANNAIVDMASERGVNTSGSAVAGVALSSGLLYPFNVGDCRVYRLNPGKVVQLTTDHTLGAKKVSLGIYTEEEAELMGELNMLTSFLGVNIMGSGPRVGRYDPFALGDDALLICSDGLTNTFKTDTIRDYIFDKEEPLADMVTAACQSGLKDNVTCILIRRVD